MASNVQRWYDENKYPDLMDLGQLRKVIRKALVANQYEDIESNIDLLFHHLTNTNRLAMGTISLNEKTSVKAVKLAQIG